MWREGRKEDDVYLVCIHCAAVSGDLLCMYSDTAAATDVQEHFPCPETTMGQSVHVAKSKNLIYTEQDD